MPHRGDGAALLISMPCSMFGPIKSLPSIGRAVFLVGCVSGCTMTTSTTNTFQYSIADSVRMELMHEDQKFLEADETELLYVDEQDDTGEDRPRFGFGPYCPIELTHYKGVSMCRSFRIKHNCCRSVVSESMARNYLARHCFDSSHHPTHLNKEASFRAANSAPIVMTTETLADRKLYRNQCNFFAERKEQERNRDGHRGQRNRVNVAFGSKGGGKHKKEKDGGAIGAVVATSSSSSSSSAAVVDDRVARKSQAVKVELKELETLEACIGRAIESQKRTMEFLDCFSRMIQDERQVFTEARNAIAELIFKANLGSRMPE